MSDMSGGEGWWRASDGKWYPPEQHPDQATTQLPAQPPTQAMPQPPVAPPTMPQPPTMPPTMAAPPVGGPPPVPGAVGPPGSPAGRPSNAKWIVVGAVAVLIVAIAAFLLLRSDDKRTAATATDSSPSSSSSKSSSSSSKSSSSSSSSSSLGPQVETILRKGLLTASDLPTPGFVDKAFTPTVTAKSNCGNQSADTRFPPDLNIGTSMVNASAQATLIEQLEAYSSEATTTKAFEASKQDYGCTRGTFEDNSAITFGPRQDVASQLKGRESYQQSFTFGQTSGVLVVVHLSKSVLFFQFFAPTGGAQALPDPLKIVEQGIEKLQA